MSTIHCETLEQFVQLTAAYTREGLGFTAYVKSLVIELNGSC